MSENTKPGKPVWTDPDDDDVVWTEQMFRDAAIYRDGQLVRRARGSIARPGRPPKANPKQQVTLRLDPDVLAKLRETGKGWQSRVNEELRKVLGL